MARSRAGLAAAELECRELGAADILVMPLDVTDAVAVDRAVSDTADAFGRVDAIVHCAAVLAYGRFEDLPADVFDQVIRTNLGGTANVARSGLRQFHAQGNGRLVLVSSLLGKVAVPYFSPYVTSKWAVHGLAAVVRQEARKTPGIDVTVVSPGSVDTPIYARAATYLGRQGRPIPPVDQPDRVATEIVRALEHPRRGRSVGRANHLIVATFRLFPGLLERLAGPLTRRFALQRNQGVAPTTGNVFGSTWSPGISDTCRVTLLRDLADACDLRDVRSQADLGEAGELPPWLGDEALHASHRSALVRKDPEYYGRLFDDPPDLPYVWPSSDREPCGGRPERIRSRGRVVPE